MTIQKGLKDQLHLTKGSSSKVQARNISLGYDLCYVDLCQPCLQYICLLKLNVNWMRTIKTFR